MNKSQKSRYIVAMPFLTLREGCSGALTTQEHEKALALKKVLLQNRGVSLAKALSRIYSDGIPNSSD